MKTLTIFLSLVLVSYLTTGIILSMGGGFYSVMAVSLLLGGVLGAIIQ